VYEHMFGWSTPSPLTRRAHRSIGRSLSLARSFLLLEDDYDVDWEVDQDESGRDRSKIDGISDRPARGRADVATEPHPHRAPLRRGFVPRRPDQPVPASHFCVSPVSPVTAVHQIKGVRVGIKNLDRV